MENNFDKILHKYLSGEDLNIKEIQLVESHLTTHPETLKDVVSKLPSTTINSDIAIGIDLWATTLIKDSNRMKPLPKRWSIIPIL